MVGYQSTANTRKQNKLFFTLILILYISDLSLKKALLNNGDPLKSTKHNVLFDLGNVFKQFSVENIFQTFKSNWMEDIQLITEGKNMKLNMKAKITVSKFCN